MTKTQKAFSYRFRIKLILILKNTIFDIMKIREDMSYPTVKNTGYLNYNVNC
jgi:hypothetical protein